MRTNSQLPYIHISIHSLRMEGDLCGCHSPHAGELISIHSLRMEGDIIT